MIYPENDNRIFERFTARFPVKFRHSRRDYGTEVFLRDASARGMRITTRQQMFLYDTVSLIVELPDGKDPMTLNGRVVWVKKRSDAVWDVGIEFHKVRLLPMHRIYRFVNALS